MRPSKGLKVTKSGISDYNAYWSQRIQNGHFEFTVVHRKIIEIAIRILGPVKARVLDCCVGPGHVIKKLAIIVEVYGIEVAEKALEFYDFEVDHIRIWNLNQGLPLHDRPMDLIIASRVAHHLADPIAFLRDVRRTLSDHGWVMGVIPNIC